MDLALPSSYQNGKVHEPYWPVYGHIQNVNVKKFWTKPKKNFRMDNIKFESYFYRLGKKKYKPKRYYFCLTQEFLLGYFKVKGDQKIKGLIQLNENTIIKLSCFDISKTQKSLGIRIYLTEKVSYLIYAEDNNNSVFELWDQIKTICCMNNFEEMYNIVQLLGKGSFATVYQVKRLFDDQIFAAKMYYRDTLNTSQHKEKFIQMIWNEAMVLRAVEHKGISKVYEIYQQSDKVILLMEYVQGPDLYQLIKRKKLIKEINAAQIIRQIAEALEKLHYDGYVHRDLKLENVLLLSTEVYETKLVDFGFAEKINRQQLSSKAGTPGYIPPELYTNQPYTDRGDIFALGVVLFSLVGGYSPFRGRSYKEVIEQNKAAVINFDKPIWTKISVQCQELILKMCEPNPEKRYTAKDVLEHEWIKMNILSGYQRHKISNFKSQSIRQGIDDMQDFNRMPSFYMKSYTQKSHQNSQFISIDYKDDIWEMNQDDYEANVNQEQLQQLQLAHSIFNNTQRYSSKSHR